jgi:hypothetical protein
MEKIYTNGCKRLAEFFNEIGIGDDDNSKRHSLLGRGYGGNYLMGITDSDYFVDEDCLFQAKGCAPDGYVKVKVEYFIDYHRRRLNGEIEQSKEINNYEIF